MNYSTHTTTAIKDAIERNLTQTLILLMILQTMGTDDGHGLDGRAGK